MSIKRLAGSIAVVALIAMVGAAPRTSAESKLGQKLLDAKEIYHELLSAPDRGVPEALIAKVKCIAVFPHVVKGAIGYGARYGQGVISCRDEHGWGPPAFLTLTGGSVGFQIGATSSDLVLFFMTEHGARSLLTSSKITLGANAGVAAGPLGRTGEAATDLKLDAEIYSYAKSKGLFAGISVEGARIAADKKANAEYYGKSVTIKDLLFEHKVTHVPAAADEFRKVLPA